MAEGVDDEFGMGARMDECRRSVVLVLGERRERKRERKMVIMGGGGDGEEKEVVLVADASRSGGGRTWPEMPQLATRGGEGGYNSGWN